MHNNIMDRINSGYNKMSKGQKLIADYILKEYDKAAKILKGLLAKDENFLEAQELLDQITKNQE